MNTRQLLSQLKSAPSKQGQGEVVLHLTQQDYLTHVINERSEKIHDINIGVREVHGLFKEVKNLVDAQAPLINCIEDQINEAQNNVKQGREQLHIALERQRSCTII
jgi:t-SNARE complex subunit (syntaxin)